MMKGAREELHEVRAKIAFLTHADRIWSAKKTEDPVRDSTICGLVLEGRHLIMQGICESLCEIEASVEQELTENTGPFKVVSTP